MAKYNKYIYLSEEDLKTIKGFKNVTRLVDDLYTKMQKLASENKTDTLEFQKLIYYLEVVLDLERDKYTKAKITKEQVNNYITYINELHNMEDSNDVDMVLAGNFEKRSYRRIIFNILQYASDSVKIKNEALADEIEEVIKNLNVKPQVSKEVLQNHIIEYIKAINLDIYYIFLGLLETLSNEKQLKNIHNDIVATFYNLLFILPDMEDVAIKNKFHFAHNISNNHQLLEQSGILSNEDYSSLCNNYCYKIAFEYSLTILGICDEFYSEQYYINQVNNYQCLIKGTLMFMDIPTIARLKSDLQEIINCKEFKDNFSNNNYSINLILSLVDTMLKVKGSKDVNFLR